MKQSARWHEKKWVRVAGAALGAFLLVVAIISFVGIPITGLAKGRITKLVKEKFKSDIEFSRLELSLLPLSVRISDVVFFHKSRHDIPPLITLREATTYLGPGSVFSLFAGMPSISRVRLDGLKIQVTREEKEKKPKEKEHKEAPKFVIDHLVADGTTLIVYPKDKNKEPLQFDLHTLRMREVGLVTPMKFEANLKNAKPPGLVQTKGYFGPFDLNEPGDTPLGGEYKFDNADLGDFKGIGGILSSVGKFEGELDRIVVDGTADVPDFHLDVSGNKIHLKTDFHTIVDGTNGDTLLQPVVATFGKSKVVAKGGVYGTPGVKGKAVRLDVDVDQGRIEDMMRFAIKSEEPLLTGPIQYVAKVDVPQGKQKVAVKLKLDGEFKVPHGRFTDDQVKEKLGSLSNKAKGEPKAPPPSDTATNFGGRFQLAGGVLTLPDLSFDIPGAQVRLHGTYHLLEETVDFKGVVRMEAKVSETTTGVKSFFLKLVDPLLKDKKDGKGSEIPVSITGHRSKPKYGLDVAKTIKR